MSAGDRIVNLNLGCTVLFAITAAYAAVVFDTTAQWIGAATAMGLFAIGVVVFLWSYWTAVQRSRREQIAVTELYFLLGPAVPARVRRTMNGALALQFVIAFATTLYQPSGPDGNPGSSLAVGFLVPMLGFGLNGWWASRYGNFSVRTGQGDQSHTSPSEIRQNAEHG